MQAVLTSAEALESAGFFLSILYIFEELTYLQLKDFS